MLPKTNRLKKNKDFKQVFKKGQFFKEDFLTLKILSKNENKKDFSMIDSKNNRFGFIVSSKVSKKAVLRNKIKRWLKAAILPYFNKKNIKEQKIIDMIIIVKPGIKIKNFQEVKETIDKLFKKTRIF